MNILGIDYGEKYLGLAMSKDGFITDLEKINFKIDHKLAKDAISSIKKLVVDEKIETIVVGLANRNILSGNYAVNIKDVTNESIMASDTVKFAKLLKKSLQKSDIFLVDESYTSKEALKDTIKHGIAKNKRQSNDHQFAAKKIIERYLEEI